VNETPHPPPAASQPGSLIPRLVFRLVITFAVLAILLFGTAGCLNLPFFWAYLIVLFGVGGLGMFLVHKKHPTLLRERIKPAEKGRDRYTQPAAQIGSVLCLTLSAWDVGRAHWSAVPAWLQVLALLATAGGLSTWIWAMLSNPFFSSAVRIQRDRGHAVVSGGPYRWVRHPGYAAALLLFPSIPLTLGSWVGIMPMLPVMIMFLWRARLEDRLLRGELEGYEQYAARVRFRVIPGIW
jgi:protein-S-isoprenylcysteine O-methyltransferase Ste14